MEITKECNTVGTVKKGFLDRYMLKYLLLILMTVDHLAVCFPDQIRESPFGIMHLYGSEVPATDLMRFFGRIVAPIIAFLIAEGFAHTSNVTKYRRRIGLLAIISWFPSQFLFNGFEEIKANPFKLLGQSVLVAFYFAIVALCLWEKTGFRKWIKILFTVLLCFASLITDMPVVGVLAPLFHHIFRNDRKKRYISISLIYLLLLMITLKLQGWYATGIFLAPLLIIFCYNGKGGKKKAFHKWLFYVYFPVHMIILGIFRWYF